MRRFMVCSWLFAIVIASDVGRAAVPGSAPSTKPSGAAVAPKGSTPAFLAAKRKADSVETPMAAVSIWQEFIDNNPKSVDLDAAKSEMAHWQILADDGAEKINGKWIGGDERKAIVEKARKLTVEANEDLRNDQTLAAVKKLQDAAKIYPNSFEVNFLLGYVSLLQNKLDDSIKSFEQALRQRPNSPEALANLGIALSGKKQYERSITSIQKAAEAGDSKEIAQNLVNAIAAAPEGMKHNTKMKPAIEAARLLASKYGINGPTQQFVLVFMHPPKEGKGGKGGRGHDDGSGGPEDAMAGMMSSGTGFIINEDGLIVTNRHVVDGGKTFMVLMPGNKRRSATVVVMDDEQDLALVKIKSDDKLPYLHLSKTDAPGDGAECIVMGYPLIDRLGAAIKVTRGIVSSAEKTIAGADVLIDAKVNPGNSGGPIVDKNGNVMAVVCMKSLATAMEDSYGIGISAGHVRKFLVKNKVTVEAGDGAGEAMSTEDIATKVKPATVCILATR
jgi:S1-C subfamily serine protease